MTEFVVHYGKRVTKRGSGVDFGCAARPIYRHLIGNLRNRTTRNNEAHRLILFGRPRPIPVSWRTLGARLSDREGLAIDS